MRHATQQAQRRYNLPLTDADIADAEAMILFGDSRAFPLSTQLRDLKRYSTLVACRIQDRWLAFVVIDDAIVACLPERALEPFRRVLRQRRIGLIRAADQLLQTAGSQRHEQGVKACD